MKRPKVTTAVVSTHESITLLGGKVQPLDTKLLFDAGGAGSSLSPVDRFIENCNDINKLTLTSYLTGVLPLPPELGSIVLLGYVSAVESYFRAMIAGLVHLDEYVRFLAEAREITFGAAVHHDAQSLPEALLEEITFSSRDNIVAALKDFVRVRVAQNKDLESPLSNYQRICELRHCCVHRFGRLGSRNAIKLGMSSHSTLLEKPLRMNIHQLQEVALALRILVKAVNATVFKTVIERTAKQAIADDNGKKHFEYSWAWKWKWNSDRARFQRYYSLFASERDATPSPEVRVVYDSFRAACRP